MPPRICQPSVLLDHPSIRTAVLACLKRMGKSDCDTLGGQSRNSDRRSGQFSSSTETSAVSLAPSLKPAVGNHRDKKLRVCGDGSLTELAKPPAAESAPSMNLCGLQSVLDCRWPGPESGTRTVTLACAGPTLITQPGMEQIPAQELVPVTHVEEGFKCVSECHGHVASQLLPSREARALPPRPLGRAEEGGHLSCPPEEKSKSSKAEVTKEEEEEDDPSASLLHCSC